MFDELLDGFQHLCLLEDYKKYSNVKPEKSEEVEEEGSKEKPNTDASTGTGTGNTGSSGASTSNAGGYIEAVKDLSDSRVSSKQLIFSWFNWLLVDMSIQKREETAS